MTQNLLLFTVHSQPCALPLTPVKEMLRPPPVEPIAGAPSFVLGAAIVRGAPTPIIDAGTLISGTALDLAGRLILIETDDERRVGLAVSTVLGVYPARSFDLREAPALLADTDPGVIATLGRRDNTLLSILTIGHFVPDMVWASLQERAK